MIRGGMFGNVDQDIWRPSLYQLGPRSLDVYWVAADAREPQIRRGGMIRSDRCNQRVSYRRRSPSRSQRRIVRCSQRRKAGGARPQRRRQIDADPATRRSRAADQRHDRANHVVVLAARLQGGFQGSLTGNDNMRFIARIYNKPFDRNQSNTSRTSRSSENFCRSR